MITRGHYVYRQAGKRMPIQEQFTISQGIIESHQHTPEYALHVVSFGEKSLISYTHFATQTLATLTLWQAATTLQYVRTVNLEAKANMLFLDEIPLVSSVLNVFQGQIIATLSSLGGRGIVFTPALTIPHDSMTILTPVWEMRSTQYLRTELLDAVPCKVFSFKGSGYDETAHFWLSTAQQLIRYTFDDWEVQLIAD